MIRPFNMLAKTDNYGEGNPPISTKLGRCMGCANEVLPVLTSALDRGQSTVQLLVATV